MAHETEHKEVSSGGAEINLPVADKEVLRKLASELAEIAALPVHKEKARLWTQLNDRKSERPMVWINQVCWHEMDINGELTLQTSHPWAQDQECRMRRTIYQWRHLPADMIVNSYLDCPAAIESTGFGITEDVDVVKTSDASDVVSRHFNKQISQPEDLEKIKMPVVTHDKAETARRYEFMCSLYDGIMPVKKTMRSHVWCAPWDNLIRWWGIEEAMVDMYDRPEFVHAAVDRVVDAYMAEMDQFESMGLLALDNTNISVGSGGYGYASELPGDDYNPDSVRTQNMWGCSNAQIFSEVSPEMQWEFAIKHDLRWLKRWGMTYYGCCEPLSGKSEILSRIPNLRKVSVSPWCNNERAVETLGGKYVLSRKPNPAIFAEDNWRPERARAELLQFMEVTGGKCDVELIMKDISTVRYKPQRLWEWSTLAMEVAEQFAR